LNFICQNVAYIYEIVDRS